VQNVLLIHGIQMNNSDSVLELGDPRRGIGTAAECMRACCSHETCGAWQFQETLGCFYNTRMFSCQRSDDPILFEPHVGRRKLSSSRTYTGPRGNPAVNWKRKARLMRISKVGFSLSRSILVW
jgi:hypothetical protein